MFLGGGLDLVYMKKYLFIILLTGICSCASNKSADIILIIPTYTMNSNQPWAEAVAVKNNKIIFVGNKKETLLYKNESTHLIENPNGMVLPGFIDSHVHLLWGGIEMSECYLHNLQTEEEIYNTIKAYIKRNPNIEWIRGSGWLLPVFPNGNPLKEWLDKINVDKPIYLLSADGHSAWVNSKALDLAGINEKTQDPPNGVIERYPNSREPSGILREDAMALVHSLLPPYKKSQFDRALEISVKEANKFGITTILDAGTEAYPARKTIPGVFDGLDAYREASKNNDISIRVASSQYAHPEHWRDDLEILKKRRFQNEFGSMNIVKIFIDGVIEGGTAALIEPYLGTDNYGILIWNPDTLNKAVSEYEKAGFQVHVHATGDRGIRYSLDAFEYARKYTGFVDPRHIICHTQLVHPDDIGRFGTLNVISSFQALWAYPDKYINDLTLPRLGKPRSDWNYPINSIIKAGGRIAGGSDWTVSSLNPLDAIEVAITRKEPGNKNGEALIPEEAVTLETILNAYTLGGAYSLYIEDKVGSIEVDKLADIVILDRNLFKIHDYEIHQALVDYTIFNGKIIYKRY